ncbi:30S ribosomal protein S20 [Anaerorhabdus sp.]|uniref:30S ribosomal protein S20 n=1 Tax=bioreactor metagenome TaxID=1076179 RepID=A0A645I4F4_9ZZZZ|nr:30S ribosomal protein S20 [Anaerorhabdus sp.]MEA4874102.1 30S ribosomal protein S20 [Anaerorhabdus sp.]
MANIKSQKKRAITNLKRNVAKAGEKTALKTAIKDVLAAVAAKDKETATTALNKANSLLDKAITSHIKHDNYVARQKARLAKAVNAI